MQRVGVSKPGQFSHLHPNTGTPSKTKPFKNAHQTSFRRTFFLFFLVAPTTFFFGYSTGVSRIPTEELCIQHRYIENRKPLKLLTSDDDEETQNLFESSLYTMEIEGQSFPREPEVARLCEPQTDVAVGIVSSLEPKYQALARSFIDGWGRYYPSKLIFVAGEVNSTSVPDSDVRKITRNGFEGVKLENISLEVSPGHEDKPDTWKRGQHLFLEAAKRLMTAFPTAQWYFLVDQDSTIRPHCVQRLLEYLNPDTLPLVVGDYKAGVHGSDVNSTIYGGSGTLWNAAAASAIDIEYCIKQTMVGGEWQGLNSDRRTAKCFHHFNVGIVPTLGMHQLYLASMKKDNAREIWYPHFNRHQCTISMHRLEPEMMLEVYRMDRYTLGCPG